MYVLRIYIIDKSGLVETNSKHMYYVLRDNNISMQNKYFFSAPILPKHYFLFLRATQALFSVVNAYEWVIFQNYL